MKRIAIWLGVALLVVVACGALFVYQRISTLDVAKVTNDVHVIYGLGSNVGILRTSEGAVVVDTMTFRMQGREVREKAEQLGGGATRAVINTHYHLDHTHGNPAFAAGLPIVSTEKTLAYLKALDADYWKGDAAGTLPNETFAEDHALNIGGKTIRMIHPGRGHTDGDLVVLFVEDRVLHTGDLFFNGRYPNIDLEAGGSVKEWADTLDRVLALDFDQVIPGHGPVTDRAGLVAFQNFMRELAAVGDEAKRSGASLEQTEAQAKLSADEGYEVMAIPFVMRLDRNFVVKRAWQEATGNFTPVQLGGTGQ
ncbi:MAG TPA: MBL fold metallo-hydrolase [Myxococcota bacterium]|nr:MBL fold metallo-hydrolase [Myxococcota bacterium]